MDARYDLRQALSEKADEILVRLTPAERETLLVKCWMSHDARWYMAVAAECGLQVANRLNRIAAHEVGKAEARRIARALRLPPVTDVDECLLAQETLIGLLGPDLLEYDLAKVGDDAFALSVQRCFAYDNASRAGVTSGFGCGIFARMTGWLAALGLTYELTPSTDECLKARGRECIHTVTVEPVTSPAP
ncbi:MAG: hypothetical protein GXP34_06785 [Actinobacteria bacterium]|nr:hypothetical protein [Actinomycetota bacterium]